MTSVAIAEPGRGGEVRFLGEIPTTPEALQRLVERLKGCRQLSLCYEAGPCGDGVHRLLSGLGQECSVVAPSLIPCRPGDRVKTKRRDATTPARLHRAGELTPGCRMPPTRRCTTLDRATLTRPRKRRRRVAPQSTPLAACRAPNDVWAADFKGWFRTGDGNHVEHTVSDGYSRFLLRCEAVGRADECHVWPILAGAFREHGRPRVLRTDNGPPFASLAAAGLSQLAVKLIKAGVVPQRIAPGKPQQNGRHERLHLTLKQDTAAPPAPSLAGQIARFVRFRRIYNSERPHEALGQVPPARFYTPSPRSFDGVLRAPDDSHDAQVRRVRTRGEPVGLFPLADDAWLVKYGPVVLGTMKGQGFLRIGPNRPSRTDPHKNKTRDLSPMLPV